MSWNKRAKEERGHGDTLDGQMMRKELSRLTSELHDLRLAASTGGPDDVLPRWRGEIRRRMLMLPATERLASMSWYELECLADEVGDIRRDMGKYSVSRLLEITRGS